jgi:hypothetical protein
METKAMMDVLEKFVTEKYLGTFAPTQPKETGTSPEKSPAFSYKLNSTSYQA